MFSQDTAPACGLRYIFQPKAYPHAPGYPRLDVYLQENPVLAAHARSLQLDVVDGLETIRRLTVHHSILTPEDEYQVCAGRILASNEQGHTMQLFTFGGELFVQHENSCTTCTIISPAPILHLGLPEDDISERLAEKVEALLARRRAAWSIDLGAYQQRLVEADPHALYCACLDALCERFRDVSLEAAHDFIPHFADYLEEEIEVLRERREWPQVACSLEELV